MKRSDRILSALLLLGAAVTIAYWVNYFVAGDVRVVPDLWYSAFEDAFPVADGWMTLCLIGAGIGFWRGRRSAPFFGLMAGSALLYLAAMDITFNVERGLYGLLPASGAMVTEAIINAASLALGIDRHCVLASCTGHDCRRRGAALMTPMRPWFQFMLATLSAFGWPSIAAAQRVEALWYLGDGEKSIQSFIAHADQIAIVAPQVFAMDSTGRIRGHVDPRVIETARARSVKLMPLVVNPGFDQRALHRILTNRVARTRALRSLAALCRVNRFDGIQFDFENIHIRDKDAFTAFTRQAVDSVHHAGCQLSAALVPRLGESPGTNSYDRWIYDNWRGAYDLKALADTLDFISYMTYAQHTGASPPGPVAGYPWMTGCLRYLLSLGVSPSKISLGLASYSDWWYPTFDKRHGPRLRGADISYGRGKAILDSAGVVPVWDSVQKAPHAEWEDHGVFRHAWLEDARAFMAKLELVNQYHLRGYSAWVLGTEDDAVWGLLEGHH